MSDRELEPVTVVPERWVTYRYAGASGDFNPIHLDDEFARSVGLPGRILHGLWTMSQIARLHTEGGGGPASLRSLSAQFRGYGVPEKPLTIRRSERRDDDGATVIEAGVAQDGADVVRNSVARLS